MPYQDDPNINARQRRLDAGRRNTNWPIWIAGVLGIMLVFGFLAYGTGDRTDTASNNNRPAATAPATTGSGAVAPANTGDAGSAPVKPAVPAGNRQ
jgi:hypothetical protein